MKSVAAFVRVALLFLLCGTAPYANALTYAEWIATFPSLTGDAAAPGADPDSDGIPNLMEYALHGCDPTAFTAASELPTVLVQRRDSGGSYDTPTTTVGTLPSGGYSHLVLRWRPRAGVTDLAFVPQTNTRTLNGWHWGDCATANWTDGTYQYARMNSPLNLWEVCFMRLKVNTL